MLKQEVASLSARVALLESQKRDLELANQDLSERLADLERTSGRTDMCHRELQKDFVELRDTLFKLTRTILLLSQFWRADSR